VSSLSAQASLVAAASGLELVQSLIGAMRTADIASAADAGASSNGSPNFGPAAIYEPATHIHPEPIIEPRQVIHPTPRIEPRAICHPIKELPVLNPCSPSPITTEPSHIDPSPIQPPWKVLPWQCPNAPALMVKLVVLQPDNTSNGLYKGSVIDCFI
jgi:hypothetical protein